MRGPEGAELGNSIQAAVGTERSFRVMVGHHSGPPLLPHFFCIFFLFNRSDSPRSGCVKTQFHIPPHINLAPRGMLLSIPAEYLLVEHFPLTGKFQFMWSGKLLLSNKPDANESH